MAWGRGVEHENNAKGVVLGRVVSARRPNVQRFTGAQGGTCRHVSTGAVASGTEESLGPKPEIRNGYSRSDVRAGVLALSLGDERRGG